MSSVLGKMSKSEMRRSVIDKCIEILTHKIEIAKDAMNEQQQLANEYGPPKDRYDSFRSQLLRKRDLFGEQAQNGLDDLDILYRIEDERSNPLIGFGAIVVTSKQKLFISVGLGKFDMEGDTYFAVSMEVPIVQSMKGLKQGEEFEFRGEKIKVLDVF